MNENLVEILIYLYENYLYNTPEEGPHADQDKLREELRMAGFIEQEISHAFDWLDELVKHTRDNRPANPHRPHALRIYTEQELLHLDTECRSLLLFLEQIGIIDAANREMVIERAMALGPHPIMAEDLKWVILLVLMNQPENKEAFARMEEIVYNEQPVYLH